MLRELISKLTAERLDPTRAWPSCHPETPVVDLARRTVGSLRFGDTIDGAQVFGRPDRFRWSLKDYCELLYCGAGFQIDFDAGRLVYATFFLGPDSYVPKCSGLRFASIRIDGHQISREMSVSDLQKVLGRAVSEDRDEEEIVVCYARNGLTLEFEAIPSGGLKRVSVFPKDDEA